MLTKLIRNDIKGSKLITTVITLFILLAAMLTALAASLLANLLGAIDSMMLQARTPHFLQMHSGDIDMAQLRDFAAKQDNIQELQVLEFLNIEGADIIIGENTLSGSVQDNGLSVQGAQFDFLLDLENNIIHPAEGEVYVPTYYMREGLAKIGDDVTICGAHLTVAGFLRDSQMNSAFVGSKRFLVNEADFERVREYGRLEYLIEFRLYDISGVAPLETAYLDAGLPSNGPPAITYSLFRLANAINDGIVVAVLVFISFLVIIITLLCLRFTLLAKAEEDYREIGVLKVIGLRVSEIKRLYLAKYGIIALVACVLGFGLSIPLQRPLMRDIRLYMGEGGNPFLGMLLGLLGTALIFAAVVLYVSHVLRRFRRLPAAEALRRGAPEEKSKSSKTLRLSRSKGLPINIFLGLKDVLSRKRLYVTMLLVLIIAGFIMVVPQNIYNTISHRRFMTYIGVGECDMVIGVQQVDSIPDRTMEIAAMLAQDQKIADYSVLISYMFDMKMEDGTTQRFKVELGDHSAFSVEYSAGGPPQAEEEIAISTLNADDLGKTVGDTIILVVDGVERRLLVCGVYSDITNGGMTAKAVFQTMQGDVLWSTIPIALGDNAYLDESVARYRSSFSFAKVSNINDYLDQTFGTITKAIQAVSYAAVAVTALLAILITLLFMKMLVAKDRYSIAVLKSLGFTGADVENQYITRSVIIMILGVIIGTALSNTLGEMVGVALISYFGATSFRFVVDPVFAYLLAPLLMTVCVIAATLWGVSEVKKLKVSEFIKE